jgi:hypothetical protein
MADEPDAPEPGGIYTERDLQLARFHALGGGRLLEEDIAIASPTIGELTTPLHRDIVKKLAAAGLSNQAIADILGISKERTQETFAYELGTGFELASANLSHSLFLAGVSGNHSASIAWLRNHNRSTWRTKDNNTGNQTQSPEGGEAKTASSRDFLGKILADMMTNKNLKGTSAAVPVSTVKAKLEAPVKAKKGSIRKPRQEIIDDENA